MRSPREVVAAHLDAVRALEVVAMAADYAPDAVLVRGAQSYRGHAAIAAYFVGVPDRLAGGRVEAAIVEVDGAQVRVRWRIVGGPGDGSSGQDQLRVSDGMIIEQTVELDDADF